MTDETIIEATPAQALRQAVKLPEVQLNARTLFGIVYVFLAFVVVGAVFTAAVVGAKNVRVETRTVQVAPKVTDGAGARRVLGTAQGQVAGEDVNPELKGATCDVYQYPDSVVLLCHQ